MIKIPDKCLICGEKYMGGHALPNEPFKDGLRIFYHCGASMSVKTLKRPDETGGGTYQILYKNCYGGEVI